MEINKKALNYPFDLILIKMLPIHTTENTRKTEREKNYKIQLGIHAIYHNAKATKFI